ncbi:unnamed protein product (macronuclear) [Paramecium tetraurelia]|uniref:Uncharacterized protein n=1 Tax=Paramecium tetraurelia TaxID=5888 RepID=A0CGR9_PARTE|nr:uncharacterized protein GSPATT00007426001 [Paramecium tetraurelia]CAK69986.1 unnamed protein product [Paramecium tetraurelia]|eukprot:XP_001437383.1 hypothetical protein (macronuclear) [Paramecium tetraurelia strain d4-2]
MGLNQRRVVLVGSLKFKSEEFYFSTKNWIAYPNFYSMIKFSQAISSFQKMKGKKVQIQMDENTGSWNFF